MCSILTRQLQNFPFLDSVDPFGKASACLREAASAKAGAEPFDDGIISFGPIARIHPG
jgi:hypothetical protein